MNTKKISLWSGPRNVSTALMYSFAQRTDTLVIDEPLYAHYLSVTGANHPGKEEVLQSMENNGKKVVDEIILENNERPILFIKNMAHHFVDLDDEWLAKMINVFLIRNPEEMLPSLVNHIPNPILRDTGLQMQWELFEKFHNENQLSIVIDAKELLINPSKILKIFCDKVVIPYDERMLKWKAGAIPEDGIWAKYWYHNVHQSTGFSNYKKNNKKVRSDLEPLLNTCFTYYHNLYQYAIKV